jgi:hypothetical protein
MRDMLAKLSTFTSGARFKARYRDGLCHLLLELWARERHRIPMGLSAMLIIKEDGRRQGLGIPSIFFD